MYLIAFTSEEYKANYPFNLKNRMKSKLYIIPFICCCMLISKQLSAQDLLSQGRVNGNFQTIVQSYYTDSTIDAEQPDEAILSNTYFNLNYTIGKLTAGVRFEANLNTLEGYPNPGNANNGTGFPHRYISYTAEDFEITVGSFYEQFGSGLILRSYEEKDLGFDNSLDGVRVKSSLFDNGIILKGFVARQRYYFDYGPGIIRGFDAEFDLNQLLKKSWKTQLILGTGFVSKYQDKNETLYKLPNNVGAFATRLTLNRLGFNMYSEYAYKINDPSVDNNYIYKEGQAIQINSSYSRTGLGVLLNVKWSDNMSFRSDRTATSNDLQINYLTPVTKSHTYSLAALYPYATQATGEFGISGEVLYKFKRASFLGGKYGTQIALSYARVMEVKRTQIDTFDIGESGTEGYKTSLFQVGDELYFEDFNAKLTKKISKKFKGSLSYFYIKYNNDILLGAHESGIITSNIIVSDLTYVLKPGYSIRTELQHAQVDKDNGNWACAILEYNFPHWFVAAMDQYNYGNSDDKAHYYYFSVGYNNNTTRVQLSYGRQREGIVCLGGVCRSVPSSNGFNLNLTHSF